jgi:1-acyl-sn-glycerol-3-phosphate acyltransferase
MGKNNIEKYSLLYTILKGIAKFWHNNVYYRKVITVGQDYIDYNAHNIFSIIHQNALMDALAMIFTAKGQPVFLSRASAFKKKFIANILYAMKMLPVFRIRDGYETIKHNDKTFDKTIDVILNKNGLGILPEGNHAGFRRLRMLKKGICRIAFQTEMANDFKLDIKIVPVAVEYSHYYKFRQVVTVIYGKPIGFKELHDLYREKPQVALNELRDKIAEQMKAIMIHIESEEDYEAIDELREIINGKYCSDTNEPKVHRDQDLIKKMEETEKKDPDLFRSICDRSLKIKNIAENLRLGYYHLDKTKPTYLTHVIATIGLIALAPIALYGFITNLIFYRIPNLALKNIKDEQFWSTMRFGISLAMAIVFVPIYAILAFLFLPTWWIALLVLLSILPSGYLSWNYFIIWKKLREGVRVRKYINRKNPEYKIITNLYNDLQTDLAKV